MRFWNDLKHENKVFYTFLAIHLIVWTCIGLIRTVLPTDSLEGIYWGSLHDFGTPKHPPLAGWLTYLAWIPFKKDFFVYLLSQTFIILGFIYIYRLAKNFVDENKAMLSVIILEGCWCYSYITGYYGFNPDVVLLFTLPAITFYFYQCMKENKTSDWIKLGLIAGFSFLDKYQTGLLIIAMATWAFLFRRKTFVNKKFYFAVIIAFIIFLPHLLWLVKYDFFPLLYFDSKLAPLDLYGRIIHFILFILMQVVMMLGSLLIYSLLKFKTKTSFKFIKNKDEKFWFLTIMMLVPFVLHIVMCLISGGNVRPQWNYVFWFLIGLYLFYTLPLEVNTKDFDFVTKLSYTIMLIVFLSFGTMLTVEKNYRSRYPVANVFGDLKEKIWKHECGTAPLKYIGGFTEWAYPITIYAQTHPNYIMDTFGYKSPWLNEEDLKASGALILSRHEDEVLEFAKQSCPYVPADYQFSAKPYSFILHNALGMPREYTIYYVIIPPME